MLKNNFFFVFVCLLFSQNYGMDSIVFKKIQKRATKRATTWGSYLATGVGLISLADQLYNEKYSWKQSIFTGSCLLGGLSGLYFNAQKCHRSNVQSISNIRSNGSFIATQRNKGKTSIHKHNEFILEHSGDINIHHEIIYMIINGVYYPTMRGHFTYENGEVRDEDGKIVDPINH